MTIPDDILLDNERVIHETKLHWVGQFKGILYSGGYLAAFILFVVLLDFQSGWLMWPITIVWLVLLVVGVVGAVLHNLRNHRPPGSLPQGSPVEEGL